MRLTRGKGLPDTIFLDPCHIDRSEVKPAGCSSLSAPAEDLHIISQVIHPVVPVSFLIFLHRSMRAAPLRMGFSFGKNKKDDGQRKMPWGDENPYRIFGVPEDAPYEEVEKAFKELVGENEGNEKYIMQLEMMKEKILDERCGPAQCPRVVVLRVMDLLALLHDPDDSRQVHSKMHTYDPETPSRRVTCSSLGRTCTICSCDYTCSHHSSHPLGLVRCVQEHN